MNILAVDSTSCIYKLYLLVTDKLYIATCDSSWAKKQDIVNTLNNLLKKSNLIATDLNIVGAITGPGSYTGLRTGLAMVNALGVALDIPVIGLSLFEILIHTNKLVDVSPTDLLVALVDNTKGAWFVQYFNANNQNSTIKAITNPMVKITQELALDFNNNNMVKLFTNNTEILPNLGTNTMVVSNYIEISANNVLANLRWKYQQLGEKKAWLEPLYIKPPKIT